jgi:hypothetical protein
MLAIFFKRIYNTLNISYIESWIVKAEYWVRHHWIEPISS